MNKLDLPFCSIPTKPGSIKNLGDLRLFTTCKLEIASIIE